MTDIPRDSSKARRSVSEEAFAQLLSALSPDIEEAGRQYTLLHAKLVGFFSMKGVSDPMRAADETIDRAAIKIANGAIVPDVGRYCFGIARYVAKESLRNESQKNLIQQQYIELPASSSAEEVERIYNVLQPCFEQLAVKDQQLLLLYHKDLSGHARAEHRCQLAETMKTTVLGLRMRVTRLRAKLTECLKQHLNNN